MVSNRARLAKDGKDIKDEREGVWWLQKLRPSAGSVFVLHNPRVKKAASIMVWPAVALLGAWGYAAIATHRGEHLNSVFILMAALCTYALGYRFYSKWIAAKVLVLDDRRATPAVAHDDGRDFVKTNKWVLFGHHFAAISGPGPLVGPVLAAQFGYLPGTLWILIGAVLGGAVQDFVILFCSLRRDGKSIGQMVREELNPAAGVIALLAVLSIILILLAVLALVIVNTLADSPWGVFTVGATIPIAMFMGGYMRFMRVGKVLEASAIGVVLLLLAVWGGQFVHGHADVAKLFTVGQKPLACGLIVYGFAASVLPVWLVLAPRDYLSTFMKLGTIFALALGCFLVLPDLKMPALTKFIHGGGLVVPGALFPFCFITIACGAISGFHSLISSGTTPKLITRESYAREVGYGAMCLESLVAIMAVIAACTLNPGVYMSVNYKADGTTPALVAANTVAKVNSLGPEYSVSVEEMNDLARQLGEGTVIGRTGGASTLAVGMARIFSSTVKGRGLDLWYHFAVMFEALFILTTLDAGTRVGRYLLQDALGAVWKPLGDTKNLWAGVFSSLLMVAGWGYFLIQGVIEPQGGVRALWPLFGIANQMLAAIALSLATTIILKMQLAAARPRLRYTLVTLIPLAWLLLVTLTAAVKARAGFIAVAAKAAQGTITQFNNRVDAVVTTVFIVLLTAVLLLSLREWILLLARKRLATLRETEPVWLPGHETAGSNALQALGLLAICFLLAKELSGEAALERARIQEKRVCECGAGPADRQLYIAVTTRRFKGVNRCC